MPSGSAGTIAAERRGEAGLAVGGEAHHLVLVAEAGEAQELGDRGVEEPQRVREVDAIEHLARSLPRPTASHRRDEVAEAVDREAHRLLERRAEEGRGEVGEVVLDGMERRQPAAEGAAAMRSSSEPTCAQVAHPRDGARRGSAGGRGRGRLAQQVGARLARHGEGRHLAEVAAHLLEAEARWPARGSRPSA